MKIDLNKELLDFDKESPLKDDKGVVLTLKAVCISSLLTPMQDDDFTKKMEKFRIYEKIISVSECDLTAEEIVVIQNAMGKVHFQLVLGQCYKLLNA